VEDVILSKDEFPEYFSGRVDFESLVNDWIYFDEGDVREENGKEEADEEGVDENENIEEED